MKTYSTAWNVYLLYALAASLTSPKWFQYSGTKNRTVCDNAMSIISSLFWTVFVPAAGLHQEILDSEIIAWILGLGMIISFWLICLPILVGVMALCLPPFVIGLKTFECIMEYTRKKK